MCIFYRLCIVLGSHLLFIRHHMRSSWPLGLKLLAGRNILRVPEGMLPCVPGSTTTSPWVNFYTPILYWAHLRVTGPGILCLCLPGTDWRDVLGTCLGCTHMPGSMWDVPMLWGTPSDVPAGLVCAHLTQAVTLCTKGRISFHFGAQLQLLLGPPACAQHCCISALTGTFSLLERRTVFPPSGREDSLQGSVCLSPLRMNWDFSLHHGPRAPPTAPGSGADPAFPSISV